MCHHEHFHSFTLWPREGLCRLSHVHRGQIRARIRLEYREVARKVARKRSHPLCMKLCVLLFRNLQNINNMAACIHCDPAICHELLYGYLHLTKSSQSRGRRDLSDNTSFIQQKLKTLRGKEAYPSLQLENQHLLSLYTLYPYTQTTSRQVNALPLPRFGYGTECRAPSNLSGHGL